MVILESGGNKLKFLRENGNIVKTPEIPNKQETQQISVDKRLYPSTEIER
jgi:hypothetical protein